MQDGSTFGIRCPSCLAETRLAHQGKLNRERTRYPSSDLPPVGSSSIGRGRLAVLLDNIRSAGNVGSILRSAEGFGFSHAFLCGITPTPENDAVQKTALGAQDSVTWSYHKDAPKLVRGLKAEGWKVFALEEDARGDPIHPMQSLNNDTILTVGNEITGVDPDVLNECEHVFYIPMRGEKKSFNVAVAFGIAAYRLTASL